MITLFCVKASESSNSDNFYLTGVSKHFFILSPRKFYLFLNFWKIFLTKNPLNWKGFFVKASPLRNIINAIRDLIRDLLLLSL